MAKDKVQTEATNRPRGGRAKSVSEMLPNVGRAAFRRFGFIQSSIVSRWKEIVGDQYATVSAPESIRFPVGKRAEGTLTLMIARAHAPMMQHVQPIIIERVNRFFGYAAVSKIVMRQGDVARPTPKRVKAELVAIPVELGDSLRSIADPELKAVLESLAQGIATNAAAPIIGKIR